jgi:predicted MPP superfamily phosphohydrolase
MALQSAVLRFSDYETDTIAAHAKVMLDRGQTWWGWWKKDHEPWPHDRLVELTAKLPAQIALVNRSGPEGTPQIYLAVCSELVYTVDGDRMPSPDPQLTPDYYSDSQHPAWLLLSGIRPLAVADYDESFGEMPVGDPTMFFVVVDDSGNRTVEPSSSERDSDVVDAPGEWILHISDLHFGDHFGFAPATIEPLGIYPDLETIITDYIASKNLTVGVVVVSGDLVTFGADTHYEAAEDFLNALLSRLRLRQEHVVVVPGNHDIPFEDAPTRKFEHEKNFRRFLRSFYGRDIQEIERVQSFRLNGGGLLRFIALNSARPRSRDLEQYGYVGRDRYARLLELGDLSRDELRVAVLHHHLSPVGPVWIPEQHRPVSVTLDAGQLLHDFELARIRIVLHGHQHMPFMGTNTRALLRNHRWTFNIASPIVILGCGGTGVQPQRLWPHFPFNSFSLYKRRSDGLEVRIVRYARDGETHDSYHGTVALPTA